MLPSQIFFKMIDEWWCINFLEDRLHGVIAQNIFIYVINLWICCLSIFGLFISFSLFFIGVPKLDDANNAGTKHSLNCTLILTEGDSAKTLAISGLSVVGRDNYGVFPLRGKMLNVRDASHKQVLSIVFIKKFCWCFFQSFWVDFNLCFCSQVFD